MIYFLFPQRINFGLSSGQVLDMINNPHYLYRMTILRSISLLAPVMGPEITCSKLLPVVITTLKDRYLIFSGTFFNYYFVIAFNKPGDVLVVGCFKLRLNFTLFRVPNIKFNVAKVLQSFISIVDQSVSKIFLT